MDPDPPLGYKQEPIVTSDVFSDTAVQPLLQLLQKLPPPKSPISPSPCISKKPSTPKYPSCHPFSAACLSGGLSLCIVLRTQAARSCTMLRLVINCLRSFGIGSGELPTGVIW